jgi:hypothetical protein
MDDFEDYAGLAGDVLLDHRDIDALMHVAEAICLRNRLALGGGKIGALGPVELAQFCDDLGGRANGAELLLACRILVDAYAAGTLSAAMIERAKQALECVEAAARSARAARPRDRRR